jgi:anti-sigma B factor antagonist
MGERPQHLQVRTAETIHVVSFSDRKILEELSIREIEEELFGVVTANPSVKLLLDFSNVEHLSSAALGMLINLQKEVEKHSGRLKLTNINPQIYEVFKITRLNKIFEIHDKAEQAISAF